MKTLIDNKDVIIRAADKGGGVVIQSFEAYNEEALNILADSTYYEKVASDTLLQLNRRFQKLIEEAQDDQALTKEEVRFINVTVPNRPHFYHPLKIHKPKQRPFILGINSVTSNLSHYLDLYLQDYVKSMDSYLRDSGDLIKIPLNTPWSEGLSFLRRYTPI